ncbi:MAG: hypothetical protein HS104_32680 [Polyangiaceae bacterium]|nr:hypothetical protein [Polyangiaceae bacterium]MCL4756453.1 hypothetical protein [Myxococcales bacterium]
MKRALLTGFLLVGATLLSGCPIYPEDRLVCETSLDCPDGYACSAATGYCYLPSSGSGGGTSGGSCDEPKDCDFNETCSSKGVCKTGTCKFHGCVAGYTCAVEEGTWTCVGGGSGGTGGSDAGSDAASDADIDSGVDASSGGTGGSAGSDAATGGAAGNDAASGGSGGSDAASD